VTGIGMLLKQIGLDPERVLGVYRQFEQQFPAYLNAIGQKVNSIDQRLAMLEQQNAIMYQIIVALAAKLEVKSDGSTPIGLIESTGSNRSDATGAAA